MKTSIKIKANADATGHVLEIPIDEKIASQIMVAGPRAVLRIEGRCTTRDLGNGLSVVNGVDVENVEVWSPEQRKLWGRSWLGFEDQKSAD